MAGTLPDDVIVEILAKLPVKSLLQFKCVCKTWYSTISSPQFCTKLHWERPSVLICRSSKTFWTLSIESLLTGKNKTPPPLSLPWETEAQSGDITPLPSEPPRWEDRDGNYFIGSCNGLVCVDHKSSKTGHEDLILWNPSTGKFRRLPRCSRVRKERYYNHYVWFGYDESIHDYKLVWLDYHQDDPAETKLNVFTLKSNAWRRTDDPRLSQRGLLKADDLQNPRAIGVLSNGAIHWRTHSLSDQRIVILSLDLATENFQVLDFPNYPFDPRVGGSCLAGTCSCKYDADFGGMSLQIVKECGCGGIALRRWETLTYYPILFSSGKEILAVFDRSCEKHKGLAATDGHRIIKFRIEEGGERASSVETVLEVPNGLPFRHNIVLHMEELVSLGADGSGGRGWEAAPMGLTQNYCKSF